MRKTSEWVSLGHPDKVADYISCYLLDRYLEKDPNTRFAVEVQIKDNFVTLGGEVTSTANYSPEEIAEFVRTAVNQIGYTAEYQKRWGKGNTICGDEIVVTQHIGHQSPDIAQGVDANGWGDQGIFHGMAVNTPETDYMPADWYLAKKIGQHLYNIHYSGLDIKTQVTMLDGKPEEIVVAIPMLPKHNKQDVASVVQFCCGGSTDYKLSVNGTGRFVKHGPVGDCGTTGRKLAVDFYGGNCVIGGGSPWTKDGTKADLSLNMLARARALSYIKEHPECPEVHCAISCRIGSPEILVVFTDKAGEELLSYLESVTPAEVMQEFGLNAPVFASLCRNGLFYTIVA
jgi:S-adenosylmethionine synthetase